MTNHISAAECREGAAKPKRSKYGNVKTTVDGITFDSKAEAVYYQTLKIREKADEVADVELQPRYPIAIEGRVVTVPKLDFKFYDCLQKRHRHIDVKGKDNALSRLKRKLIEAYYGIDVEVVKA